MKLKVNDIYLDPIRVGDRLEFRFNAPEDLQYVTIEKDDFIGDLELSEIQLEQSTISTTFVEPMESETVASGVFKSVQGISYEITDPNSDTWASIKQTVDGSITTYHNGTLQSTIAHTIEDIIFGISDIAGGDSSSFNLRLGGIQQSVKNQMFSSVQTQLAGFVGIQLEDIEGNYNTILNTVNAHSQTIGSDGGNVAQKVMNDSLFRTSVIDRITGAESSVTQMSDYINLRVNGSQISIGGDNITIDSKSIYLGSSTQIGDGVITNRMIASNAQIDAAKITNLTVSNAQITSLDVSKLSGNKADFVRAAFNGINSTTTIDSLGMSINSASSWKLHLGSGGMTIRNNSGTQVGAFMAGYNASGQPEGSFIMAELGYKAGIGHRRRDYSGLYYSSLYDDATGDVKYFDDRDSRGGSLFDSIMKYNVNLGSAGSYFRIGDIQIAWRTINSALAPNQENGNIFRSETGTTSFPAPFASTPVVVMSSAFAGRWVDITGTPTLTDVSYRLYSSLSSTATGGVYYIAIGRWK